MAESIQRIIVNRALAGQYSQTREQIIDALEATAKGWNQAPTPFIWGGKRHARRLRSRQKRHALGGSAAYTHGPVRRQPSVLEKSLASCQVTHNNPLFIAPGLMRTNSAPFWLGNNALVFPQPILEASWQSTHTCKSTASKASRPTPRTATGSK
jgi:hypothetical protein